MSVAISIKFPDGKQGSLKLKRLTKNARKAIKQGLTEGGVLVEDRIKLNLSGKSHVRFPGNGNPFPGVLSGGLRGKVFSKVTDKPGKLYVEIGSNKVYARTHELGDLSRGIPKRSFIGPAWSKVGKKVVAIIAKRLKGYFR